MRTTTLGRTGLETSAIGIGLEHLAAALREAYGAMPVPASGCTACGACTPRCPFGADPMERVQQAAALFES